MAKLCKIRLVPQSMRTQLGMYHNAGYGMLRVEVDDESQGTLIGLPVGFGHMFRLQHISGDYLVACLEWSAMGDGIMAYLAGRFVHG